MKWGILLRMWGRSNSVTIHSQITAKNGLNLGISIVWLEYLRTSRSFVDGVMKYDGERLHKLQHNKCLLFPSERFIIDLLSPFFHNQ